MKVSIRKIKILSSKCKLLIFFWIFFFFSRADEIRRFRKTYFGSFSTSETYPMKSSNNNNNSKIAIFYNLFVNNVSDVDRVTGMVEEVQEMLIPGYHREFFVTSIGVPVSIPNTTLLMHTETGNEYLTLHAMWQYCTKNPQDKVVYLHSKGSFHPSLENDLLRVFISRGALSEECANLPGTCNVCSSRMTPKPHPHTSGNMFLARCEYVIKLIDPANFTSAMGEEGPYPYCFGRGRYAAEHWVHSHPTVKPCDLYNGTDYFWGYGNVPTLKQFESAMELAAAPRFDLRDYRSGWCAQVGWSGKVWIQEYERLYGQGPPGDWWGWSLYDDIKRNDYE